MSEKFSSGTLNPKQKKTQTNTQTHKTFNMQDKSYQQTKNVSYHVTY